MFLPVIKGVGGKEGGGGRGRNDPNIVCTYEFKKKVNMSFPQMHK
jgi:hypothetical protein